MLGFSDGLASITPPIAKIVKRNRTVSYFIGLWLFFRALFIYFRNNFFLLMILSKDLQKRAIKGERYENI